MNNLGHVVGYSVGNGIAHATWWQSGIAIDLGANAVANSINDSDQVVGYRMDDQGVHHAFLWPDQIDLGALPGFDNSVATGINSSGTVVGIAYSAANPNLQAAFIWTQATGMQVVAGCASAEAINDSGQVSGIATNLHATICGAADFGMVGAAIALNSLGQAVGFAGPDEAHTHAWFFPSEDLGPTDATGINDYGWVCGDSITAITGSPSVARSMSATRTHLAQLDPRIVGTSHPWVWSQDSGIIMLSGIVVAAAINQSGQIVGTAVMDDGSIHGVLLTGNKT